MSEKCWPKPVFGLINMSKKFHNVKSPVNL